MDRPIRVIRRAERGKGMHVATPEDPARYRYLLLIGGALAIQFALVSLTFPLAQLLTEAPLFYIDAPFHWYQIGSAKSLAASGNLTGYDPHFAAGYVGGVGFNASAKFPAVMTMLLSPWLSDFVSYKLYVFIAAVLAPACVAIAAWLLGLRRDAALMAIIFGTLAWWVTALRWFHTVGSVSFVLCSYFALPYAALIVRCLVTPVNWLAFGAITVAGAIGFFMHPLFPILVAPLVIALIVARWREVSAACLPLVLIALPAICLALNLPWIIATLSVPSYANGDISPYQKAVDISIVWHDAIGALASDARGSRLNPVLWVCSLCACGPWLEREYRRLAIAFIAAAVALILLGALGASSHLIATLQPNRFATPAYLFLCVPAGLGAVAVFRWGCRNGIRSIASVTVAIAAIAVAGFFAREITREVSSADIPHHGAQPPEVRGIGPISTWILGWLRKHTDESARILFETSKARIYDHAVMAGYYALVSNREFIGGPYPYMHFAGFWDDFVFGRPIESISPDRFQDYLRLYNIGWVIAFSEESKRYFDALPYLDRGDGFGLIQTYSVKGARSFFLEGDGAIAARSINHLELDRLSGAQIMLKYHYVKGLRSIPPARLEPVRKLDDPDPFIRIVDPPPHLILKLP